MYRDGWYVTLCMVFCGILRMLFLCFGCCFGVYAFICCWSICVLDIDMFLLHSSPLPLAFHTIVSLCISHHHHSPCILYHIITPLVFPTQLGDQVAVVGTPMGGGAPVVVARHTVASVVGQRVYVTTPLEYAFVGSDVSVAGVLNVLYVVCMCALCVVCTCALCVVLMVCLWQWYNTTPHHSSS